MKVKKENALVGIDVVIAIVAISIFSILMVSLMHNNVIENIKLKKESLAMIYITEIFEKIGIENYEDVTEENINNLISQEIRDNYEVELTITNQLDNVTNGEDIIKKITLIMSYEIEDKTYSYSMERMKIKE